FDIELVEAAAGDPEHVAFEALDVLRLFLELRLRNENGEIDLAVAGRVELVADRLVDQLHDRPSVGPPDVHSLDRIALVAEFRAFDDLVVPLAELFVLSHGMRPSKRHCDNILTVAASLLPRTCTRRRSTSHPCRSHECYI